MKALIIILTLLTSSFLQQLWSQDIEQVIHSKPIEVSGSINANTGLYHTNRLSERAAMFRYGIAARLNIKLFSFNIPFYASIRDHRFNYGTTFTRLKLAPEYKWIKLHFGDTYMKFNPYTLYGRTVKGYGITLRPGKFRFKAIYGKLENLDSYRDTLRLGTIHLPSYTRKTLGVGIGVGTNANHFDLFAVKTWDDLDSLANDPQLEQLPAQDNFAVGSSFSIRLFKKRVRISANAGASALTEQLNSYGENIIVGKNSLTSSLIQVNLSSKLNYAGDASIRYKAKLFSLQGKVKYIQPYYKSLSVAYLNTDIINYTLGGQFNLFKKKLLFNGSIGIQRNNLSGVKLSSSNQLIANIIANIRFSKALSANLTFSNFSQDYQARLIQIDDLFTYAVNNKVASLSLKHKYKNEETQYNTSIGGGWNSFITTEQGKGALSVYSSKYAQLNFRINKNKQNLSASARLHYRTYERVASISNNYGLSMAIQKGLWGNNFKISLNSGISLIDKEKKREGTSWRNEVSLQYLLSKSMTIGLRVNHLLRNSHITENFSEYRSSLHINYKF